MGRLKSLLSPSERRPLGFFLPEPSAKMKNWECCSCVILQKKFSFSQNVNVYKISPYLLKCEWLTKCKTFNVVLVFKMSVWGTRVWDLEADVVWRKGYTSPPTGQDLGMAGGRGLPPDWPSATKSRPLAAEDCAMLQPQVGRLSGSVPGDARSYLNVILISFP